MSQIHPFTGAIIQSGQVSPRESAEKDRQIRRAQNLGKNAALQGDRLEHQVESADAPPLLADAPDHPPPENPDDQNPPHVDLIA